MEKSKIVGCTQNIKSHDVSEFYVNRLLCEICLCTVLKKNICVSYEPLSEYFS